MKRIDYHGARHFVTNRGTAQTLLFRTDRDRRFFLALLSQLEDRFAVRVIAYVLMGNHYHLILESAQGRLAEALHFLDGNYARWFNVVYERTGTLFQGRYDDRLITDEVHLERAGIYLHLNPVSAALVTHPGSYPWSSFPSYRSGRSPLAWLRLDLLRWRSGDDYQRIVMSEIDSVATITHDDDSIHAWCCDDDAATEAAFKASDRVVADVFGSSVDELYIVGSGTPSLRRTIGIVNAAARVDRPQAEIARHYGLRNVNEIYNARRRLCAAAAKDQRLAEKLATLDIVFDERLAG